MPVVLLMIPVVSTLVGGLLAVRFQRFLPVLIAASAGLLLGATFLDLLPEGLVLGGRVGLPAVNMLGWTLLFFLGFLAVESLLDHHGARAAGGERRSKHLGRLGGGMLIFHSFRDGMAIGAAFSASHVAGYAVALGITAHDLGDGMNTVILTTRGQKARRADYLFLLADALAPFAGGLLTIWWLVSSRNAVILLALAAGFFLQIATSELLPQVRATEGKRVMLLAAVAAGAAAIYGANMLAGMR
jgi:zinc and cadmium transporter